MKKVLFPILALVLAVGLALPMATQVSAQPAEVWVDDDYDSSTPTWGTTHFDKIQDGINAVASGGTVNVAAGTYIENITINKSLTLKADSSPIIDGQGMFGPAVNIQADDVTFQGFTIEDFKATPAAYIGAILVEGDNTKIDNNIIWDITTTGDPISNPAGIGIDVHANNVEVTNNIVHDVGSIGIRVRHDWATPPTVSNNVLLKNNTVYRTRNTGVLVTGYAKGVTIKNNEIYESLNPTPYSLFVHYGAEDIVIQSNNIHDPYDSIYGHNVVLAGCTNITIVRNTIYGATSGKNIYILTDYLPWVDVNLLSTNINIINNDIQNGSWGIRLLNAGAADASQMPATTTIKFNNISGNTQYGVQNLIATDVNAENNWWGHASGPSGEYGRVNPAGKVIGKGDAVSDNVQWEPWLPQPVGHTKHDPVPPGLPKRK